MAKRTQPPEYPGHPESFGRWVAALRAKLGLSQGAVAARVGCSRNEVTKWENGDVNHPNAGYFSALCRFVITEGALHDHNSVYDFCISAGYVPIIKLEKDGAIRIHDFENADDRFVTIGQKVGGTLARTSAKQRTAVRLPFDEGLARISDHLRDLRPPASKQLVQAERRLSRLLKSQPRDLDGMKVLAADLTEEALSSRTPEDRFSATRLLGQLLMGMHNYDGALLAFQESYYVAKSLSYARAPWALEALAQLCDAVAKAHLAIGTSDSWELAGWLLRESLSLRQKIRDDLEQSTVEVIGATLDTLLELARVQTHAWELHLAEKSYLELLKNPHLLKRPFLHASTEKELADTYRLAERPEEAQEHFERALSLYKESGRASAVAGDAELAIEVLLNVAYCLRRLGNEEEAVDNFRDALTEAQRLRDLRRVGYACLQLARSPMVESSPTDACAYLTAAMRVFEITGAQADLDSARMLWNTLSRRLSSRELGLIDLRLAEMGLAEFAQLTRSGARRPVA